MSGVVIGSGLGFGEDVGHESTVQGAALIESAPRSFLLPCVGSCLLPDPAREESEEEHDQFGKCAAHPEAQ